MNKSERITAAKERLRTASAAQANNAIAQAQKARAADKATLALKALAKRGPMIVYREKGDSAPQHARAGFVNFTLGGYGSPNSEKEIVDGLASGGLKVSMPGGGSITVAASTVLKRSRIVSPLNAAMILRAQKALDRAYANERAAFSALKVAEAAAFDAGAVPMPPLVIGTIAKAAMLRKAIPSAYGNTTNWTTERLAAELAQAEKHYAATKSGERCDCQTCLTMRRREADTKAEAERLATLPKLLRKCPDHGERRMPSERRKTFLETEGWVDDYPVVYCPVDGAGLRDERTREADKASAAKAARKAAA